MLLLFLAGCGGVMPPAPIVPPPAATPPEALTAAPGPSAPVTQSQADTAPVTPAPLSAKPAAKSPAPAPPPPPRKEPDVAKQSAPPLDITSLKQRLKDTKAIGVLTKITLKNQVDDLLDQFRAFYQGKLKITLAELRRSYDLLVQKVLSLLQDSDPSLATAIVASRDQIWGILSDPAKFATI
jgi:hypothetical protein